MSPRILLLLFMDTVLAATPRPDGEGKPPALRVSPTVNVTTLISANPLLKKLSMFSESPVKSRSVALPTTTPFPADKKIFSRSPGDNFNALYKRLNESLFNMADSDEKTNTIDPAADALPSDDSEEWVEENEIEETRRPKETIEEEPFAVTESLLTSLQPQETTQLSSTTTPIPLTLSPNWEASPWTSRPPASRTFAPLPEILEPVIEDEVREVHRNIESDTHARVFKGPTSKETLVPLHRASEWQVQESSQGRFLVSGTQFYEDNRIDGGVMREDYRAPSNEMEVEHMRKDPRFAVEAELTRMRAHAAKLKQVDRPIARAAKTVSLNNGILLTSDHIERFPEKPYRSKSQIIDRNGRKIELRTIDRQGKLVEVELTNPLLWHHDYISAPGAIIHGPLKNVQKRFKLTNVSKCFEAIENTRLSGAVPIDRKISKSIKDCLKMCTKSQRCKTVVYEESLSMCEIFSERAGEASFQESTSSTLFQPIVEDPQKCLNTTTRAKMHAAPTVQKKKKKEEEISYDCPEGEDHILTRQEGIRAVDTEWKDKIVTNEDDCVSTCLNGPKSCLAAGYSHETQECVVYNSIANNIEVHEPTTLYSKMCVPESTATKCYGATIEHVQQAVLLSSMREAKKVSNKAACLKACLNTKDYTCMSVMFYPKEKTNCILNDGSLSSSPDSFVEELNRDVEYFGVEECYGIQDVTHRTNYIVEDDIRQGQITSGSRLDTFLRS